MTRTLGPDAGALKRQLVALRDRAQESGEPIGAESGIDLAALQRQVEAADDPSLSALFQELKDSFVPAETSWAAFSGNARKQQVAPKGQSSSLIESLISAKTKPSATRSRADESARIDKALAGRLESPEGEGAFRWALRAQLVEGKLPARGTLDSSLEDITFAIRRFPLPGKSSPTGRLTDNEACRLLGTDDLVGFADACRAFIRAETGLSFDAWLG